MMSAHMARLQRAASSLLSALIPYAWKYQLCDREHAADFRASELAVATRASYATASTGSYLDPLRWGEAARSQYGIAEASKAESCHSALAAEELHVRAYDFRVVALTRIAVRTSICVTFHNIHAYLISSGSPHGRS